MKKNPGLFIFLISLGFIFFESQALCQAKTNVSITPEFGFINGKIIENVWYVEKSETQDVITLTATDPMSRLDWQIKNSMYYGLSFDFCLNELFKFSFGFKNANSYNCGIMEDYDWLNPIDWPDDDKDELTNYSIHTNHLNNYGYADFSLGLMFFLDKNKNISLTPSLGLEMENYSFVGIGGWKTYKKDNWKKYSFEDKKVISYSQNYYAPVLSLEADFNYAKHFETTLKLDASWIKQIDCMDIHHAKNAQYNDRIQNAWKFGGNIGMYYKINQMHKLGLKGNIAYIPPAYGFTYGSTTSTSPDTSSLGGTSRLLWNYSFVYVFSF